MALGRFIKILPFVIIFLALGSQTSFAKRSSEQIYTEPFDLAAGGTTLTRASQEGIVFANPALLPLGAAWIRWVGLQTGFMIDRDLAESGQTSFKGVSGSEAEAEGEGEGNALVQELFSRSLHAGQTLTLGFLNKNFAFTVFDRIEVDVEGDRFGNGGLPAIRFSGEAYAGGLITYATQPVRWFSMGMTTKYLYMAEPDIFIPVTDEERIELLVSNPDNLLDELKFGTGVGVDVGTLLFWQNTFVDLSLGMKVEDLGGTQLSNGVDTIPQTLNAGLGLAFHGSTEVLHLSLDYRDIGGAYEEKTFKKVYAGARLMIRQVFGAAVGLYQGIPTVGVRVDLFLFKLGVTAYGRELGTYPGDRQRNMVMIYTSFGF